MHPHEPKLTNGFKATAVTLIVLSLAVQLAALALSTGYWRYQGLADSNGNRVGFNNPLTHEHIGMLVRRGFAGDTIRSVEFDPIHASILMAHGLALIVLFSRRTSWFLVGVFALTQIIALFWGALGVLMLLGHLRGSAWTGESIVEGPLSTIAASGVWFAVSCVLFVWLAKANQLWSPFRRGPIRVPFVQFRS
jgi:hypothetical protein